MSYSTIGNLLGFAQDPRQVAIVKLLIEKTNHGKVRWAKQRNAITASLPGLEVNFVTQPNLLGSDSWQLFTVRDAQGNELVRTTPPIHSAFTPPSPMPIPTELTTLPEAVDQLFTTATKSAGDDLDRAISTIKSL